MSQDWNAEDIHTITLEFGPCDKDKARDLLATVSNLLAELGEPVGRATMQSTPRRFSQAYVDTQDPADYFAWSNQNQAI